MPAAETGPPLADVLNRPLWQKLGASTATEEQLSLHQRAKLLLSLPALLHCFFSALASTCFRGDFKGRLRAREVFAAVFTEASSSRAGGHPSPDGCARQTAPRRQQARH